MRLSDVRVVVACALMCVCRVSPRLHVREWKLANISQGGRTSRELEGTTHVCVSLANADDSSPLELMVFKRSVRGVMAAIGTQTTDDSSLLHTHRSSPFAVPIWPSSALVRSSITFQPLRPFNTTAVLPHLQTALSMPPFLGLMHIALHFQIAWNVKHSATRVADRSSAW